MTYIDVKFEKFAENLPHGSGINCDWNAYETANYVYFQNSYHCMNEHGFYEGYQDFSIRVDLVLYNLWYDAVGKAERFQNVDYRQKMEKRANSLLDIMAETFTLHFNGGQYLATKHMLRDYLTDTINYSIQELETN